MKTPVLGYVLAGSLGLVVGLLVALKTPLFSASETRAAEPRWSIAAYSGTVPTARQAGLYVIDQKTGSVFSREEITNGTTFVKVGQVPPDNSPEIPLRDPPLPKLPPETGDIEKGSLEIEWRRGPAGDVPEIKAAASVKAEGNALTITTKTGAIYFVPLDYVLSAKFTPPKK